jgi:hypothetical protein
MFNTMINIVKALMRSGRGCPRHNALTSSSRAGQINWPTRELKHKYIYSLYFIMGRYS